MRTSANPPSLTTFGCKTSGETAFRMAGLTPKEIDVAELYDCFTITVLIELEDLGFCKKGEGGAFVQGGRIALGGEQPINIHGGLLSHAHPGVPGGIFHVIEAVPQLRGEAGERQLSCLSIFQPRLGCCQREREGPYLLGSLSGPQRAF